jgi:6-phosphogluconolactonase
LQALSALAENPHLSNIEWEKWHVFWVDERVVPISHQDSNYNNAKVSLPLFHDYLCAFSL